MEYEPVLASSITQRRVKGRKAVSILSQAASLMDSEICFTGTLITVLFLEGPPMMHFPHHFHHFTLSDSDV